MSRGTIVLLILVLALGGFLLWDSSSEKTREASEKQEKRLFPEATVDNATSLTVAGPDAKEPALVLEHRDGRWVRQGAQPQLVSVMEVGAMANRLLDLERTQMINEHPKPEDLGQFGLDKPAHTLTLQAAGKTYTLLVGAHTPDGGSFYARSAPAGPVVTVPGTFSSILEKKPEALRELSVLPGQVNKAVKMRMLRDGQEAEVVLNVTNREESKDEDEMFSFLEGEWSVNKPYQAPADGQKVDAYLNEWSQLKAGRFLAPDEKVDFSQPELRLEVWEDKKDKPQIFEVGPPVQVQPTMRYVRRLEPEEAMVVDFSKSELLSRDAEHFRDRHLLALKDVNEVEKVEVKIGEHELEATLAGHNDWKISRPKDPAGDKASQAQTISTLMWEVQDVQSTGPAPAGAVTGLDKPAARLTLYRAKGEKVGTLLVGATTPDGKGRYVQLEGRSEAELCEHDLIKRWGDILEPLWPSTPSPSPGP